MKQKTYVSEEDQKRFRSLDAKQRRSIARHPNVNLGPNYVSAALKGDTAIDSPAMQEAVRLANEILEQTQQA